MTHYRQLRRLGPGRQGGAILLFFAIGISLIVTILALTDIGFLYYYKREYQKAADLAAMAGARGLAESVNAGAANPCSAADVAAQANKIQNLGSKGTMPTVSCGLWSPTSATPPGNCVAAADLRLTTPAAGQQPNAVRAYISGTPPHFLLPGTSLSACAIAGANTPLAALQIRNELLSLDTQKSALLNALVGGLLGGNINLSVGSWQGLIDVNINLLDYLNALGPLVGVDLSVGGYEELVDLNVSLLTIIDAAIQVVGQNSVAGVSLSLFRQQIVNLALVQNVSISLGQLLGLDLATSETALGLDLNLFDLIMASVQIANAEHAVYASVPITLPGNNNVNVLVTVIEAPQFSKIGNPATTDISVKTAQVRAYVSIKLGLLQGINDLLSAVTTLLGPVTQLVNSLLSLNLYSIVNGVLNVVNSLNCGSGFLQPQCNSYATLYVKVLQDQIIDLAVDVGKATAKVTDYDCVPNDSAEKSLDVEATSSVAGLSLGKFANANVADPASDFYKVDPVMNPVDILQIGEQTVQPQQCFLTVCTGLQYKKGSGWTTDRNAADLAVKIGVRISIDNAAVLGGDAQPQVFKSLPDAELPNVSGLKNADDEQVFKEVSAGALVGSLDSTLNAIDIDIYRTTTTWGVLEITGAILDTLLDTLLHDILAPLLAMLGDSLLDPILNLLFGLLGIDLATAEDAANLTCNAGATLLD